MTIAGRSRVAIWAPRAAVWAPRAALAVLLALTAVLYLAGLQDSGWGNAFYAAAAGAGGQSWSAWFFGALDAGGFITVDKPPAALWITGLSVRLFGLNSWSVLAPQAVLGVGAVTVLYAAVRRTVTEPVLGAVTGLVAAAILALTPAAVLVFRLDDPDALLVLLMTCAAYCVTRAVPTASWRWLAVAGVAVGLAFLAKMAQAFLVLPGFGLAYLLFAPIALRHRLIHLTGATAAMVLAAGWWVAVVELMPASARPWVGGSAHDSVLELAFGYNGLDRLAGGSEGTTALVRTRAVGLARLFGTEMGLEASWLAPAALVALVVAGWLWARGALARAERAAAVLWGVWLLVTGAVLGWMSGTVHAYYAVTLAPPVAALTALGAVWAWRHSTGWAGRLALVAMLAAAAWWSASLLAVHPVGPPWLRPLIAVMAAVAALAVLARPLLPAAGVVVTLTGLVAGLAGTGTYAVATASTPHQGTSPVAVAEPGARPAGGITGWAGDLGANRQLNDMLAATRTRWSAATNGAQSAAALELGSGTSVMAVGGWNGDPAPTLAEFVGYVTAGDVTYYVQPGAAGRFAPRPTGRVIRAPSRTAAHTREIADWVAAHYPGRPVGDSLVYRLTGAPG